jgi:Exportin 1-like protein
MDDDPLQRVLRSIAISSGFIPISNEQERRLAFQALKDFKQYDGKMSVCIAWLHQECVTLGGIDVTLPVKLFSLNSIEDFLQTSSYVTLSETERLQLRHAILTSARQVSSSTTENRALGNKLASILAALMIRDFPQRWMTFFQDVFSPMTSGGLWCNEPGEGFHTMGVKICLECLRLVAEDTTDSDFNTKVRE